LKNAGKIFEDDFANSFNNNVFIYRLRDTSSSWQGTGEGQSKSRFTVKNVCDFIAYSFITNKLLLLELKSFKGKSCPFSNLKAHQIKGLFEYGKKDGVYSYFILNFRDLNETYALKIDLIYNYWIESKTKSFPISWCRENGILIPQKLKKVHYKFDVEVIL